MKFKGLEIGIPTLLQVEIYIAEKGFYISAEEFYEKYSKRGWLTLKGEPIKSLEATIDSFNGSEMQKNSPKKLKEKKRKRKHIEKTQRIALEKIFIENKKNHNTIHKYIPYEEQLRDKRWHIFRSAALEYYHRRCACCGSKENLQVHHIRYKKERYAWEYNFNDVVVLCKDCHKKEHEL